MTMIPEFDPFDPKFFSGDPHSVYKVLRQEAPVYWHEKAGCWILTKMADIRSVSARPKEFSSRNIAIIGDLIRRSKGTNQPGWGIMYTDPPRHNALRKMIISRFTASAVAGMESMVREVVREALDPIQAGQELDFADGPASWVPVTIMTELLGIDRKDSPLFVAWARQAEQSGSGLVSDEDREKNDDAMQEYFRKQISRRRTDPGDDLISLLVHGDIDGVPLDEQELLVYCITLMAGASQTTQSLIGSTMHLLMEFPDVWKALRENRALIPDAIDEVLRWWTPVRSMGRGATCDVELRGETIREGDGVLLAYDAANRDEEVFGDSADEFNIDRTQSVRHLAFGHGEHLCVGHLLARLEPRIVLEEVLARFSKIERTGEPKYHYSCLMNGFENLPLVFHE